MRPFIQPVAPVDEQKVTGQMRCRELREKLRAQAVIRLDLEVDLELPPLVLHNVQLVNRLVGFAPLVQYPL